MGPTKIFQNIPMAFLPILNAGQYSWINGDMILTINGWFNIFPCVFSHQQGESTRICVNSLGELPHDRGQKPKRRRWWSASGTMYIECIERRASRTVESLKGASCQGMFTASCEFLLCHFDIFLMMNVYVRVVCSYWIYWIILTFSN